MLAEIARPILWAAGTRAMYFLEQLTSEWLEYRGYFVRRHVRVEGQEADGDDCELDVVAFHPGTKHLLHVEASMDASTWRVRDRRYRQKFDAGREHIPTMFEGSVPVQPVDQVALFGFGTRAGHGAVAGGRVLFADELMDEIRLDLRDRPALAQHVSERFVCLRTIQLAIQSEIRLREGVVAGEPLIRAAVGPADP
jgi:hypothetical protein